MHIGQLTTASGHRFDEAASALQKAIRRGEELEAVYWAQELESKYYKYVWRRLEIISHEDVGMANPLAAIFVHTAREQYMEARERGEIFNLALINAVLMLARSLKTRMADHLHCVVYCDPQLRFEVPDHALDMHTDRGRKLGRGIPHFYEVGGLVAPDAGLNDYLQRAIDVDKDPHEREWFKQAKARLRAGGKRKSQQAEEGDLPEEGQQFGLFDG